MFAFEPDPENLTFLRKTVAANQFTHVEVVPAAAAAQPGTMRLFTSSQNRGGDNRLYQNELSDGFVDVEVVQMDNYLQNQQVSEVDLIKIDVQGFEAQVLAGLENTIRSSPNLILLSEFWPNGLCRTGANPLQLLQTLQSWGLTLYSLGSQAAIHPIVDFEAFINQYHGRKYTNIVGLKNS
ncbi:MAG: FkbM family methyltransferase [Acidobacteria bacterium]|nr:FkbM family methyltransferase [Acidobacteriota bacterium]